MTTPIILGIDEVGRGPWAGPLVVGAVILGEKFQSHNIQTNSNQSDSCQTSTPSPSTNPNTSSSTNTDFELQELWQSLADSKQLTAKKRQLLSQPILNHAAATGLGWVSATELDRYGLSASLKLATRRAVKQILAQKVFFSEIIIDGTVNFLQNTPLADQVTLLKKADSLIKEVSAASIIAKVARDNYMIEVAQKYPGYGFEKHVGYGTAAHKAALFEQGICPEHRTSFKPIQAIITNQKTNPNPSKKHTLSTTSRGRHAENLIAEFLAQHQHQIIAQNYKTKSYEIDLISTLDDKIYFTEVKYRKNTTHGSSLEQITNHKLVQMHYAAEKFLSIHPEFQSYQPLLATASVEDSNYKIKGWFILDE